MFIATNNALLHFQVEFAIVNLRSYISLPFLASILRRQSHMSNTIGSHFGCCASAVHPLYAGSLDQLRSLSISIFNDRALIESKQLPVFHYYSPIDCTASYF